MDSIRDLNVARDPADLPRLLTALRDSLEAKRLDAIYALGFSHRDGRALMPLIGVLLDRRETPQVRAQAAECLGMHRRRKAIKALIQSSIDESPEVRFWCVFALGRFRLRRNIVPLAIVRALEARLEDDATPDCRGNYWSVGLEALAMLGRRSTRHPAGRTFRDTMVKVLEDPITHRDQWQWVTSYCDVSDSTFRDLFDSAMLTIRNAGFDPVIFGRQPDGRLPPPPRHPR